MIQKNHLKEKNASNIIGYVTQCFSFGVRSGFLEKDPTIDIDRQLILSTCPFTPPREDDERILTVSEYESLRESVRKHEKSNPGYIPDYGIELSLLTGMRVGEISALRWDDITLKEIRVEHSEHRLDYKDKPSELVIGDTKNGKHRRIPLTREMEELFDRIKEIGNPGEFVFSNKDGLRHSGHDISCACSRRGKEAGIEGVVSIHQIRRTVSSMLREILPVSAVARMLGHNESTNTRFYNYDTTEEHARREALEQIGKGPSSDDTDGKVIQFRMVS